MINFGDLVRISAFGDDWMSIIIIIDYLLYLSNINYYNKFFFSFNSPWLLFFVQYNDSNWCFCFLPLHQTDKFFSYIILSHLILLHFFHYSRFMYSYFLKILVTQHKIIKQKKKNELRIHNDGCPKNNACLPFFSETTDQNVMLL